MVKGVPRDPDCCTNNITASGRRRSPGDHQNRTKQSTKKTGHSTTDVTDDRHPFTKCQFSICTDIFITLCRNALKSRYVYFWMLCLFNREPVSTIEEKNYIIIWVLVSSITTLCVRFFFPHLVLNTKERRNVFFKVTQLFLFKKCLTDWLLRALLRVQLLLETRRAFQPSKSWHCSLRCRWCCCCYGSNFPVSWTASSRRNCLSITEMRKETFQINIQMRRKRGYWTWYVSCKAFVTHCGTKNKA